MDTPIYLRSDISLVMLIPITYVYSFRHLISFMFVLYVIYYQIINYADRLENKAIVLIHFSARYQLDVSFTHSQSLLDIELKSCRASMCFWT